MTKAEKIGLVVNMFFKYPNLSIAQLSELPELAGISKSSIQRYLNDPMVESLFSKETANKINDMLRLKGVEARKKGGLRSFQNNTVLKNSAGQFIGTTKSSDSDNLARKMRHILVFSQLFLEYPEASLQDIADLYNESNPDQVPVTRDYVYDCLSEHAKYEIFSDHMSKLLASQLEQRRLLGNKNGALKTNSSRGK